MRLIDIESSDALQVAYVNPDAVVSVTGSIRFKGSTVKLMTGEQIQVSLDAAQVVAALVEGRAAADEPASVPIPLHVAQELSNEADRWDAEDIERGNSRSQYYGHVKITSCFAARDALRAYEAAKKEKP